MWRRPQPNTRKRSCSIAWRHTGCVMIASNPLEDLRKDLGTRDTAQIIRALLSSDSAAALEALRPVPAFASQLGLVIQNYVSLKRSLGFRYRTQTQQLLRLDRFLQECPDLAGRPVSIIIEAWDKRNPTPQHLLECEQTGKILARALQRTDPTSSRHQWTHG